MYFYNTIILIILSILLYVYWSFKKSRSFFEQNGIPYLNSNSIFGFMQDIISKKKAGPEVYLDLYRRLSPNKFGGVFLMRKPAIVIREPQLLKNILVKDFAYFQDRGIEVNSEAEPLTNHLFSMKGEEWKNLRIKLTSTFTTGKMKMMFPLVKERGIKLNDVIDQIPSSESFDIKDLAARYTTDVIGTCAFGLETGSLEDPNSEFRQMGKNMFKFRFRAIVRGIWPNLPTKIIKWFKLTGLDEQVESFFIDIVDKTIKYREENNITRYDFLDLLIALKNNTILEKVRDSGDVEDLDKFLAQVGHKCTKSNVEMSNELLAAQCFIFFLAGYETSSTTLGFCMLELAQNQEIQNKVRDEIETVLEDYDGQLTYEAMKRMTYTDMVIDETLRKYPPAFVLLRQCTQNYPIEGTNVIIPAKTPIIIPVYGLHLDEEYYDNPQEFRPERFSEDEKAKRPNYTYLPFGEGPRICIAERFAKMQVKIGLIFMLKDFSYRLSSKTKLPIEFEKNVTILLNANGGIWLQREKRSLHD